MNGTLTLVFEDSITFGKRAKVVSGPKVQCHVCGRAYHHLGNHVHLAHGMSPDQYCDTFELNRGWGLISPGLSELRRVAAINGPGAALIKGTMPPRGIGGRVMAKLMKSSPARRERWIKRNKDSHKTNITSAPCAVCGTPFERPLRKRVTTCSLECRKIHRRKPKPRADEKRSPFTKVGRFNKETPEQRDRRLIRLKADYAAKKDQYNAARRERRIK